jgi:hypothetical protein
MNNDTLKTMAMIAAVLGATTSAQEPADVLMFGSMQAAPVPPAVMWEQPFGLVAVEPFEMGDPVEQAPYSAEIVTEVTQEFADGNRIERRTTSSVARDGRGRVRREQQLAAIGPVLPDGDVRIVTISDPIAGVHYSLDSTRKSAIRTRPPGHLRAPGGLPPPPPPPPGAGAGAAIMFERRVEGAPSQDVRTEKLGSKEIEGVAAEGSRTTTTIPAGAIGNVRAIEITSERWYSPELRVVVYSRRSDPRFGDTTYRLTNIVRAEPDPTLFQVPPDYKTEEMKMPPFEHIKRKMSVRPPG